MSLSSIIPLICTIDFYLLSWLGMREHNHVKGFYLAFSSMIRHIGQELSVVIVSATKCINTSYKIEEWGSDS